MGNVIFDLKEIDEHIAFLTAKIQENRKLGFNQRNCGFVRYLAKNLKSWQEAKAKLEAETTEKHIKELEFFEGKRNF